MFLRQAKAIRATLRWRWKVRSSQSSTTVYFKELMKYTHRFLAGMVAASITSGCLLALHNVVLANACGSAFYEYSQPLCEALKPPKPRDAQSQQDAWRGESRGVASPPS